jgi:hypothetical protein
LMGLKNLGNFYETRILAKSEKVTIESLD